MTKAIKISNLKFSYPANEVLKGLDLDVDHGGVTGLIGQNGSGKTTLLKLILGQLKPDSGEILIYGKKPKEAIGKESIAYIAQGGLGEGENFPGSCLEILSLSLYKETSIFNFFRENYREKASRALESVGMAGFEERLIGELSGGQRQRVLLAKALVSQPKLLILDEPTKGLDSSTTDDFFELLKKLNQKNNMTIFIISHDLERMVSFAKDIYCLGKGYALKLSKDEVEKELSHKHLHPDLEMR